MRFQSYFNTAVKIIQSYDGGIPLHHFLKQYFSQHKKHGSKDRKIITHLCYNFYRLGKSLHGISIEEKLKLAIFICNEVGNDWYFLFNEKWINNWSQSLDERIVFAENNINSFSLKEIFPFTDELGENISVDDFIKSFLKQPDFFIRIRPHQYNHVINKLKQHEIAYNLKDEDCIALPPTTKIDSILAIDKDVVVQDYSSQKIRNFLNVFKEKSDYQNKIKVWDCCAASGGKSILAYDVLSNIELAVSDVRTSIIKNLQQRFLHAGIRNYKSFVTDLTKHQSEKNKKHFDLVICDAPCTGSGTWSRTPEQLYFFQQEKIDDYASLQKNIVSNIVASIKSSGYLLYITCSVFKKENEDVVNFIKQQFHLQLIKMELIKGYNDKADTMFAALFKIEY